MECNNSCKAQFSLDLELLYFLYWFTSIKTYELFPETRHLRLSYAYSSSWAITGEIHTIPASEDL